MAVSYKKVPTPRVNPLGRPPRIPGFPNANRATSPALQPNKTRIYTKATAGEDPTRFFGSGFGSTGLDETPSLLGMLKNTK
jgi:hypothetical protein